MCFILLELCTQITWTCQQQFVVSRWTFETSFFEIMDLKRLKKIRPPAAHKFLTVIMSYLV